MITEQQIRSDADQVAYSFQEDCLEAEHLLAQIVREDRQPNYAEAIYFRTRLGWDESELNKQRRRMGNVLRFKAIAGSAEDRAAAVLEAKTAAKLLKTEAPKVRAKIEELESKLRGIETDARLSQKRCEEQAEAVAKLREHCPQTIVDQVNAIRRTLDSTLKREILDAETRIHELQCVLNRDKYPMTREGEVLYLESVRRCVWEAVQDVGKEGYRKLQLSPAWAQIRTELESELSALQAKVTELQPLYDAELAKIETGLDYYINPQPE